MPLSAFSPITISSFLGNRPDWHTVTGGSREYVDKLIEDSSLQRASASPVAKLDRHRDGVELQFAQASSEIFDHVVLATHADTACSCWPNPQAMEHELLSVFKTSANTCLSASRSKP